MMEGVNLVLSLAQQFWRDLSTGLANVFQPKCLAATVGFALWAGDLIWIIAKH